MMLVESIIFAFKIPFMRNYVYCHEISPMMTNIIQSYYTNVCTWLQLAIYAGFVLTMNALDSKFPKARFGLFFRLDFYLTCIYPIVTLMLSADEIFVAYLAKIVTESLAVVTCIIAGWVLYVNIHINPVRKMFYAYGYLALRHFLYSAALIIVLCTVGINGLNESSITHRSTVIITWFFVIPPLIVSRWVLFSATDELKRTLEQQEKENPVIEI